MIRLIALRLDEAVICKRLDQDCVVLLLEFEKIFDELCRILFIFYIIYDGLADFLKMIEHHVWNTLEVVHRRKQRVHATQVFDLVRSKHVHHATRSVMQ